MYFDVLHRIGRTNLGFLLVTQRHEPVRLLPASRLIPELALSVGVGPWRPLPLRRFQLLYQTRRFASHDDEPALDALISFDRVPAVETRIGASQQSFHHLRHSGSICARMSAGAAGCASMGRKTPSGD